MECNIFFFGGAGAPDTKSCYKKQSHKHSKMKYNDGIICKNYRELNFTITAAYKIPNLTLPHCTQHFPFHFFFSPYKSYLPLSFSSNFLKSKRILLKTIFLSGNKKYHFPNVKNSFSSKTVY